MRPGEGGDLIRRVEAETFRRVCMSVDAWIVGFALSTLLRVLHVVEGAEAFGILGAVAVIDTALLIRFFRLQGGTHELRTPAHARS